MIPQSSPALRRIAVMVAAAVAAGCSQPDDAASDAYTVTDSVGVRLIVNQTPVEDTVLRIPGPPRLVIGMEDGPQAYLLSGVLAVARFPDGRIGVANAGTREIRIYSPEGEHALTLGRQGDGPGEFQWITRIWIAPPDTVVALDVALNRITVFNPDGSLAATYSVPQVPTQAPTASQVVGRFADGSLLLKAVPMPNPETEEGRRRREAVYARWSPRMSDVTPLDTLADGEQWIVRQGMGVTGYAVPFAAEPQVGVAAAHFHFAGGERFEVERRDAAGRLVAIVRRVHEPQDVTRGQIEARRAEAAETMDPAGRGRWERALSSWGVPAHHPAVRRLLVSERGDLWARESTPDDLGESVWSVFAPDGRWMARVELPRRFVPLTISETEVLGVAFAPDTDVEQVVAYPLPRYGR